MNIGEIFGNIFASFKDLQITDIIDIAVVSLLTYIVIKFFRQTRAGQFLKGIVALFVFWFVADMLNLYATTQLFSLVFEFGIIAVFVIFQPEIRAMLEKVGQKSFKGLSFIKNDEELTVKETNTVKMINAITDATANLAITKTGALMVIERDTKLGDIVSTGTVVDAEASSSIIRNLFYPKAPLHDGAVIFSNYRVRAAGCFLPLSTRDIGKDLGTRHHAALGMSEVSDAIVVVVSEETGIVSIAVGGELQRRITPDALSSILRKYLLPNEEPEFTVKDFIRKEILKKNDASADKKVSSSKKTRKGAGNK